MNDSPPISDISLIINTFQKPRHLGLVLQSIVSQEQVDGRFEVIVTDDGSTDSTAELVHSFATASPFPVRFITQPHDGFRLSQIRNRGARIARGKALLFLDGDCMLPHDHVAAHLHRLRPGVALIGNCARLTQDTSAALAVDQLAPTDLTTLAPRSEKRSLAWRYRKAWWHNLTGHPSKPRLSGSNFSVWLEDFKRVNGFDERFVGWGQEDDDFGLRLRGAGVRLESILDRTYSLHVWHPSDPSATRRWRDGPNIDYFSRRGRLVACRRGLSVRPATSLCWGLPDDIGTTTLGQHLSRMLGPATQAGSGSPCEVDLVVRPGTSRFSRPAECRLLLLASGSATVETGLRQKADRIETMYAPDDLDSRTLTEHLEHKLEAMLEAIG